MKWPEFLARLENLTTVDLVGPLLSAPHALTGATVFVDGGSRFQMPASTSLTSLPAISVGDGDSGGQLDEMLPTEKDYSDLAFVLRELPLPINRVNLFGFLGGRRDHELANFGEVHQFLSRRGQARANFYSHGISVMGFVGQIELEVHGLFSLLVLESTAVRLEGECKYKLAGDVVLEPVSSHGLSNEGSGLVTLETRKPAFIFLNEVV